MRIFITEAQWFETAMELLLIGMEVLILVFIKEAVHLFLHKHDWENQFVLIVDNPFYETGDDRT